MSQYDPRYRTPKQAAEQRATMFRTILWLAAIPPVIFVLMAFGYSHQAPTFLRDATVQIEAMFGRPVWSVIGPGSK